jgi:hypothetical protein
VLGDGVPVRKAPLPVELIEVLAFAIEASPVECGPRLLLEDAGLAAEAAGANRDRQLSAVAIGAASQAHLIATVRHVPQGLLAALAIDEVGVAHRE